MHFIGILYRLAYANGTKLILYLQKSWFSTKLSLPLITSTISVVVSRKTKFYISKNACLGIKLYYHANENESFLSEYLF